jgi:hypothetical protein
MHRAVVRWHQCVRGIHAKTGREQIVLNCGLAIRSVSYASAAIEVLEVKLAALMATLDNLVARRSESSRLLSQVVASASSRFWKLDSTVTHLSALDRRCSAARRVPSSSDTAETLWGIGREDRLMQTAYRVEMLGWQLDAQVKIAETLGLTSQHFADAVAGLGSVDDGPA